MNSFYEQIINTITVISVNIVMLSPLAFWSMDVWMWVTIANLSFTMTSLLLRIILMVVRPNLVLRHTMFKKDLSSIREHGFNPPHNEKGLNTAGYAQMGRDVVSFSAANHAMYHNMRINECNGNKELITVELSVPYMEIAKLMYTKAVVVYLGIFSDKLEGKGVEACVNREYVNRHLSDLKVVENVEDVNPKILTVMCGIEGTLRPMSFKNSVAQFKLAFMQHF